MTCLRKFIKQQEWAVRGGRRFRVPPGKLNIGDRTQNLGWEYNTWTTESMGKSSLTPHHHLCSSTNAPWRHVASHAKDAPHARDTLAELLDRKLNEDEEPKSSSLLLPIRHKKIIMCTEEMRAIEQKTRHEKIK